MSDPEAAVPEGTDPAAPTGSPRGIDGPGVSAWFEQNVPGVTLPLSFDLVAGGRSNLTFIVTDGAGRRYVLRRPPTGHLLPGAHDMGREFRIISAMGPAGVPVPSALGLCTDDSVNGAPFYVMSFVDGLILRTEDEAVAAMDEETRHRTGLDLVDTLAQIHKADPDRIGLGELGRKEGYIARQLRRWYENYKAANDSYAGTRGADVETMHEWLSARIPEQKRASVVHGDYRLDNCMVSSAGRVIAVLDWEICTLGDPLADIGGLLVYWPEPGERSPLGQSPTTAPGFPTRDEVKARYAEATGWDLSEIDYYVTFAYWKLACILEGVYARYVNGAMGNDGFDFTVYPDLIAWLASESRNISARLGQ